MDDGAVLIRRRRARRTLRHGSAQRRVRTTRKRLSAGEAATTLVKGVCEACRMSAGALLAFGQSGVKGQIAEIRCQGCFDARDAGVFRKRTRQRRPPRRRRRPRVASSSLDPRCPAPSPPSALPGSRPSVLALGAEFILALSRSVANEPHWTRPAHAPRRRRSRAPLSALAAQRIQPRFSLCSAPARPVAPTQIQTYMLLLACPIIAITFALPSSALHAFPSHLRVQAPWHLRVKAPVLLLRQPLLHNSAVGAAAPLLRTTMPAAAMASEDQIKGASVVAGGILAHFILGTMVRCQGSLLIGSARFTPLLPCVRTVLLGKLPILRSAEPALL